MPEKPISDEERSAFLRPYLRLAKYLPEDFIDLCEKLLFLVREYGIAKLKPDLDNPKERLKFLQYVHDGWKDAQTQIATHLVELLNEQAKIATLAKAYRKTGDRKGQASVRSDLHRVKLQIAVLRRTLDVVLWTIFKDEQSTLRRLFIKDGQNNFSIKNIDDAMPFANEINKNPNLIAVSTDILSLVHLGDFIVKDVTDNSIKFIELKSGEKNIKISKAAEFSAKSGCEEFDRGVRAGLNKVDVEHFDRAKRQAERGIAITDTIKNEEGVDQNTGDIIKIHTLGEPLELWTEKIVKCYEELNEKKKWAIDTIEGCIHIGVYSAQEAAMAFGLWMMSMECKSTIYNLLDSYSIPSARPFGATDFPIDLLNKIFRGEVLVVICVNVLELMALGNSLSPGFLTFASKRDSAEARKTYAPLEYQGRCVQINSAEGKGILGMGSIERMVFDQHCPAQLLRQYIRTPL